jgi:tRNA nucleotidyltransferase (CCA-adding enzyme)
MTVELSRLLSAIPDDVVGICRRLREHGKRGWVVGGCVRDLLRGQAAKDWDVATDALPEEVQRLFRKVIPTGIEHGTVTVLIKGTPYELTTLRGEGAYDDGRHPNEVVFLDDIVDDLARRDFTVNAIAIDPVDGRLIDPFDGQRDLERQLMRAVGDPLQRFTEDGLRILRGARFAATLGCDIEPATLAAMGSPEAIDTFRRVSAERVHDEWLKAMQADRPSVAFDVMRSTGILEVHCAELLEGVGCEQNRYHAYDVWEHTMAVLDSCHADPVLRVAALLHDVAKPRTRELSAKTKDYTFYNHEQVGADLSDDILRRLRFSNEHRKRVVHLVRHHLICYSSDWTDAAVRRWLRRVTPDRIEDLMSLGRADAAGKGREFDDDLASLDELRERVTALLRAGTALSTRDLELNGRDLMQELELAPGPIVGEVLRALVELVTEQPDANERGRLLEEARRIVSSSD